MAVKDTQYRYYPSHERLVNVSNYLINPDHACPSPDNVRRHRMMSRGTENRPSGPSLDRLVVDSNEDRVRASRDFDLKNICWSGHLFSTHEILGLKLPVIVKVVRGYDGRNGQKLDCEQILQVYGWMEQKRVMVTDRAGRILTIPADHTLNLRPVTEQRNSDKIQSLSEILTRVQLPVDVEIIHDVTANHDASSATVPDVTSPFSDLRITLHQLSDHRFLQCNPIVNGWLDQSVTLVPERLPLRFRLALGTKHTTADEWRDICGMYSRAVRHLKFHLIQGYEGIIYDDWVSDEQADIPSGSHSMYSDNSCSGERERRDDDVDNDDDDDDDDVDNSDSDSTFKRNRPKLLWQQSALKQGSLPSLPTVVMESMRPQSRSSAQSLVSIESLPVSKSTESLLPRRSLDSGSVDPSSGGSSAKRKSNVPSRLRRRKGESKKQVVGSSGSESQNEIQLMDYQNSVEIESRLQLKEISQSNSSSTHLNRTVAAINSSEISNQRQNNGKAKSPLYVTSDSSQSLPMNKSLEIEVTGTHKEPIPKQIESTSKHKINKNPADDNDTLNVSSYYESPSPNNQQHSYLLTSTSSTSPSEPNTYTDFQIHSTEIHRDISNLNPISDSPSDFPAKSSRDRIPGPIHWSSDLNIDTGVSGWDLDIARLKQRKTIERTTLASNETSKSKRSHSVGLINSNLQNWNLNEHKHADSRPNNEFIMEKHHRTPINGVSADKVHSSDNSFHIGSFQKISPGHRLSLDYGSAGPCGGGRSRTQTNGLVRMKLDLNSGSETTDDGYGTESIDMTSSLNTLTMTNMKRERAFYI